MVDAVVSFVIERLGDFIIQEVSSLRGVRDEVVWVKNKLEWMQCFLQDAEVKQDGDQRIRKWVSDIRDAAYRAEDIIDAFILQIGEKGATNKVGFKNSFKKYPIIYKTKKLYSVREEIDSLKKQLDEIQRNREIFNIREISIAGGESSTQVKDRLTHLRRESAYADDKLLVGFNKDAELLTCELLKKDPRRCVISILGMGGLGKTTLARKLYKSSSVRDKFDCYAWVCVSKDYNTKDLLQRIVKSFCVPRTKDELKMLEKMTVEDLERHLRDYLKGRRYIVVIDDVWEKEDWESLRRAFPDKGNGSKVIMTTRNRVAAECRDERTYVHELPFLNEEESWELFCQKAFPNTSEENRCAPSLEELARDMVRRCGGLPLAIIVLGGLLSRKNHDEWNGVHEQMWRHVKDGSVHVKQILALSFSALQPELKSCFLYIGLLPEDYEIDAARLLRLWVAEEFIQPYMDNTLEEVAADYLNELIDRNLIHVTKRHWRRIVTCRVHDLLRDLAVEMAKRLKFLHVYDKVFQYSTPLPIASTYRRVASHLGIRRFVSSDHLHPFLRTLLAFKQENELVQIDELNFKYTNFQLLRVLDLQDMYFESSPQPQPQPRLWDSVGNLIHLRYLGLRDTNIVDIPPSIGRLCFLQTIDVFTTGFPVLLPKETSNLKHLRHLNGWRISWPFQIDNFKNLQTLRTVYVSNEMEFDHMNLFNLRELHVSCNCHSGTRFTLESIGKLKSLRTFSLEVYQGLVRGYYPDLELLSNSQCLIQLKLHGGIPSLPMEMHQLFPNLRFLDLDGSRMWEDPMPKLEKLPNLVILKLTDYKHHELTCTSGGFPQLHVLQLVLCTAKELRVDEGGMPALIGFLVIDCDGIKIPERLRPIPVHRGRISSNDDIWRLRSIPVARDWISSNDDIWPY